MRVGIGIDAHAFEAGRRLVLGGVEIPHPSGLAGHSDGDVLAHAVVDAVLGAAALGDIGTHFPDSDARWRDASSLEFLRHVAVLVAADGARIANVDATVICQAPRIEPVRDQMIERLASSLGVAVADVSVKGTTTDRMGFTGRGDGIAAVAVALLE